jgi:hypothetical protein
MVVIVKDPEKGIAEDNLTVNMGEGIPCPHLLGKGPGEHACAVHDRSWYPETPCFEFGQAEADPNDPCRIGEYLLRGEKQR